MTELIGTHEKDIGQPNKWSGHSRHGPHERHEDSPVTPGCRERIRPGHACDHKAQLPGVVHAANILRRLDLRNRGQEATKAPAMKSMVSPPGSDLHRRLLWRETPGACGHLCRLAPGLRRRLPRVLPPDDAARGYRRGRQGSCRGRARVSAKGRLAWSTRPAPGPYLKACFSERRGAGANRPPGIGNAWAELVQSVDRVPGSTARPNQSDPVSSLPS
jgi:hypothetical protein